MMNFKKLEVTGATKEEALAKAPFEVIGNATQSYKNWLQKQVNDVTESDKKQFMINYLAKESKGAANVGFYITVNPAVANTRKSPYKFVDIKNKKGARKYVKIYQLIDAETNTILAETEAKRVQKTLHGKPVTNEDGSPVMIWKGGTKTQAKNMAKELYEVGGFKGSIICKPLSIVVEGESKAFEMTYEPSKKASMGTYIVFGVEMN